MNKNIVTILLLVLAFSFMLTSSSSAGEIGISGYLQGLYGGALDKNNPTASDYTASETRLQLRLESWSDGAEFFGRLDFVHDEVKADPTNWEFREGYAKFTLFQVVDFKVGRQILTWGTGDLIFINDLFAKDYQSFFVGRDDQYLKAPQTAIRVEYYSPLGTISFIWTPRFTPNRFPVGERFSYYNPMTDSYVGGEPFFEAPLPESKWENGEFAGRLQHYLGGFSVALYGYYGFYKNPVGFDATQMMPYYPELSVYGASLRGQIAGGIVWLEGGYYHSREECNGSKPFIPNSNIQTMIGFERQIASDLTANIQYQVEYMLDYDNYLATLTSPNVEDEVRSLITSRITRNFLMETLTVSNFVFWSPTDEDIYYRFVVSYKINDEVTIAVGGNIFDGNKKFTDFGSFALNDNLYGKVTYGF